MITKATPRGKSFHGIINYIFHGRREDKGNAQKKPEVITYSDNLEIPAWAEDKEGIKRMIESFQNQTRYHQNFDPNKAYVGHHILAFSQEDMKVLSEAQITDITNQYIKDAGLNDTQYVAISHQDTDNFHIHLVFNRCMNNRKIYEEWREKMKATERSVALNLKYDLPIVGQHNDIAKTSAVWEIRVQHEDIQELLKDPLLKDMRNLHHFKKVVEKESDPDQLREDATTAVLASRSSQEQVKTSMPKASDEHKSVWLKGLLSAMSALEVKNADKVQSCIPVADAVLKSYKDKFK